jgi:hypothetical protein
VFAVPRGSTYNTTTPFRRRLSRKHGKVGGRTGERCNRLIFRRNRPAKTRELRPAPGVFQTVSYKK